VDLFWRGFGWWWCRGAVITRRPSIVFVARRPLRRRLPAHRTHRDATQPHTTRPGTIRPGHDTTAHYTNGHDTTAHDTTAHDTNGHDTTAHDTTGHDTPGHRTRRDATQPDTTTVRIHFRYRTPLTDVELEWVRLLNPAQPTPEFFDPTQPREIITWPNPTP